MGRCWCERWRDRRKCRVWGWRRLLQLRHQLAWKVRRKHKYIYLYCMYRTDSTKFKLGFQALCKVLMMRCHHQKCTSSALTLQCALQQYWLVGSVADGAAGVGHVVHQDGHAVLDVSHQHHAVHFIGLLPLFVDESKVNVQAVCDGRHAGPRTGRTQWEAARCWTLAFKLLASCQTRWFQYVHVNLEDMTLFMQRTRSNYFQMDR